MKVGLQIVARSQHPVNRLCHCASKTSARPAAHVHQLPDQLAHLAIFREKREFFLNFFTNCKKVVANVPPDFIRPVISGNGR